MALDEAQERGLTGLRDAGAIITELPTETRTGWATSLAEFPGLQARDADSRGMPGTAVMTSYLTAVAASGYEWPHAYSLD